MLLGRGVGALVRTVEVAFHHVWQLLELVLDVHREDVLRYTAPQPEFLSTCTTGEFVLGMT